LDLDERGRGLSCTEGGVSLAGVSLLKKTPLGFEARPADEVEALLSAACGKAANPLSISRGGDSERLERR
jgi:hypothetical protein